MNLQEAMNPTIDDAIKYYKNMIFPQDMSAHTLRAVAMNKLVIKALQEKAARAAPENKALTAQWISAKDKLPEIGQRVVVKCNELYHGMFDVLCYYPDYKPWKNDGVAYWLPLPELPENTRKPEGSENNE